MMNTTHFNNFQSYTHILQHIEQLLTTAIQRHNKVLFIRFDIRYPSESCYPDDNRLLSRFIEALNLNLKRKKYDPLYLWVREKAKSKNPHYHFILLLNGNKTQNPFNVFNKATELWGRCLDRDASGLVNYCCQNKNAIMIRRSDDSFQSTYDECLNAAAYLAKVYSKGNKSKFIREIGMSRIGGLS